MKSQMIPTMLQLMAALAVGCLILTGCINPVGPASKPKQNEATETEQQRVAMVARFLLDNVATVWHAETNGNSTIWSRIAQKPGVTLPGRIEDPHFLYVSANAWRNDGDQIFIAFRVPMKDIHRWTTILEPIKPPQRHSGEGPDPPRAWWVTDEQFSRLTYFDPRPLSGEVNGWAGIDRTTGQIFVYSYRM